MILFMIACTVGFELPQQGPFAGDYLVSADEPRVVGFRVNTSDPISTAPRVVETLVFPTTDDMPIVDVCGQKWGPAIVEDFNCFGNPNEVEFVGEGTQVVWQPPDLTSFGEDCGITHENPFDACWARYALRTRVGERTAGVFAYVSRTVDGQIPEEEITYIEGPEGTSIASEPNSSYLQVPVLPTDDLLVTVEPSPLPGFDVRIQVSAPDRGYDTFAWWMTSGELGSGRTMAIAEDGDGVISLNDLALSGAPIEIAVVASDREPDLDGEASYAQSWVVFTLDANGDMQ